MWTTHLNTISCIIKKALRKSRNALGLGWTSCSDTSTGLQYRCYYHRKAYQTLHILRVILIATLRLLTVERSVRSVPKSWDASYHFECLAAPDLESEHCQWDGATDIFPLTFEMDRRLLRTGSFKMVRMSHTVCLYSMKRRLAAFHQQKWLRDWFVHSVWVDGLEGFHRDLRDVLSDRLIHSQVDGHSETRRGNGQSLCDLLEWRVGSMWRCRIS
jgi:hypothetical protein